MFYVKIQENGWHLSINLLGENLPIKGKWMSVLLAKRGLYFEDFEPGLHVSTVGRTITEGDIVTFAG